MIDQEFPYDVYNYPFRTTYTFYDEHLITVLKEKVQSTGLYKPTISKTKGETVIKFSQIGWVDVWVI